MDAIATPFVQGQLRNKKLRATVSTRCAHCAEPIELEVDSELAVRVTTAGAKPLISTPFVNLKRLRAPNIIDAF